MIPLSGFMIAIAVADRQSKQDGLTEVEIYRHGCPRVVKIRELDSQLIDYFCNLVVCKPRLLYYARCHDLWPAKLDLRALDLVPLECDDSLFVVCVVKLGFVGFGQFLGLERVASDLGHLDVVLNWEEVEIPLDVKT